jgi:hypothetical protein
MSKIGAATYIVGMKVEREDILKWFGQPAEVKLTRMHRRAWQCHACLEVTRADQPIPMPSPCKRCGNICFMTLKDDEQEEN